MAFARRTATNYVFTKATDSTAFGIRSGGNNTGAGGGTGAGTGGGSTGNGCAEIEMLMNSSIVKDIGEISKSYAMGSFNTIKEMTPVNDDHSDFNIVFIGKNDVLNVVFEFIVIVVELVVV